MFGKRQVVALRAEFVGVRGRRVGVGHRKDAIQEQSIPLRELAVRAGQRLKHAYRRRWATDRDVPYIRHVVTFGDAARGVSAAADAALMRLPTRDIRVPESGERESVMTFWRTVRVDFVN